MSNKDLTRNDLILYASNSNHLFLSETSHLVFRIPSPCLWHGAYGTRSIFPQVPKFFWFYSLLLVSVFIILIT